jgi:hypothetical protein
MSTTKLETNSSAAPAPEWLELVRRQVASLSYGVVQIVVHEAQVTQVEKTERVRFETNLSADRKTGGKKS